MSKRVAFLFGSGISVPAGMPRVSQITEKVLLGNDVMRHTNGKYYFGEPLYAHYGFPDEYVPRVSAFVKRLYDEIEQYYKSRLYYPSPRVVNYEDLYYVALQIYDSETGGYDNPIVQPFVDKILPDVRPLFIRKENDIKTEWELDEIAREATHYISDIVWRFLDTKPATLEHLCCVNDACRDTEISSLDLFTLNHDTSLEQYLLGQGIKITDGFESRVNNYRFWSPEAFADPSHKIRLFKLHGSVDWFRYELGTANGRNDPVGIADDRRYWLFDPPMLDYFDFDRPVLLVGTFNKMLEYTDRIFADLFCQFRHALRETDLLIVCGYGFGDQGINTQVAEWADSSDKSVMVVIHPNPEGLKMRARANIYHRWDRWLENRKLMVVRKRIEVTSWNDIQDAIRR